MAVSEGPCIDIYKSVSIRSGLVAVPLKLSFGELGRSKFTAFQYIDTV